MAIVAVAVALPFSGDLQQRGRAATTSCERAQGGWRARESWRARLAAPSKARFQGSQGLVRFSNPLLYPPPSKAARLLAGCSKAHHACCNLPRPMISCSFFKLLSGGISIIALSEDPFYWTTILDTSSSTRSPVCRGRVTKGLGFAFSSSLLWFLLDLRDN